MKILVTTAASHLSQALAASLSGGHDVTLTDRGEVTTGLSFTRSELGHDEATNGLVRGMDAIIHSIEAEPGDGVSEQLDVAMRCTYNLLNAAAEEGVPRLIYLSSLRILDKYGEDMTVTETWRPIPTTDAAALCYHLGEYVCREFAREQKIEVVCLRLGELVSNADQQGAASSSALYADDAAQAVERALTADVPNWSIFHIQSAGPNARYLTEAAEKTLGFAPAERG